MDKIEFHTLDIFNLPTEREKSIDSLRELIDLPASKEYGTPSYVVVSIVASIAEGMIDHIVEDLKREELIEHFDIMKIVKNYLITVGENVKRSIK